MENKICELWTGSFAVPRTLTGVLLVAIVVVTWRAKPWKKRYGSPAWDFSTSFASNLAALTAAINVIFAAATGIVSPGQKAETTLGIAVFAIFTACAPLIASVWKTPANETFFAGVVLGVCTTAFGVFGQLQILIRSVVFSEKWICERTTLCRRRCVRLLPGYGKPSGSYAAGKNTDGSNPRHYGR